MRFRHHHPRKLIDVHSGGCAWDEERAPGPDGGNRSNPRSSFRIESLPDRCGFRRAICPANTPRPFSERRAFPRSRRLGRAGNETSGGPAWAICGQPNTVPTSGVGRSKSVYLKPASATVDTMLPGSLIEVPPPRSGPGTSRLRLWLPRRPFQEGRCQHVRSDRGQGGYPIRRWASSSRRFRSRTHCEDVSPSSTPTLCPSVLRQR